MAEIPDFDTIAVRVLVDLEPLTEEQTQQAMAVVAEQLRLAWNARGAADIARLDYELSRQMGPASAGPYVENLDRALRELDR
jgi:hypothetical protein